MFRSQSYTRSPLFAAGLFVSLFCAAGCGGSGSSSPGGTPAGSVKFQQANLVSDVAGVATFTDPNLVNPWGISYSPQGPFWISDNGTGKSTLYNGAGAIQGLVVNIPTPAAPAGGAATGQVYNSTTDFKLADGSPALFIFASEDGTITAWDAGSGNNAELKANQSAVGPGAVYKGIALGTNAAGNFLFATNFRAGSIDVFDKNFALAALAGNFADPNLPAGFAPFGIQNIAGNLYVTYAKQNAQKHDDVAGPGSGLIDVFDTNGHLLNRLVTGSAAGGQTSVVNSPWGLVQAPASFGGFSNALLVGNFGDGRINAFDIRSGALLGSMMNATGAAPIAIPGLWGLILGNGGAGGASGTLYFTAGIGNPPTYTTNVEGHGLFGSLQLVAP